MAVEVMVPRLGWSMESGAFGQWLKQHGEAVAVGDPVFTIEGEKATEEVESLDAGLLHIRPGVAEPGVELTVGTVIGWLLAEGEEVPEAPPDPGAETAGAETARANAGDGSGPKPDPGTAPPADEPCAAVAAVAATASRGVRADGRPASSPRARRVARELSVDWRLASGSGKGGRIRERDVRALAARRGDGLAPGAAAPLTDLGAWGPGGAGAADRRAAPGGRAPEHRGTDRADGHATRHGQCHPAGSPARALRISRAGGRRHADHGGHAGKGGRLLAQGVPAVQRQHRLGRRPTGAPGLLPRRHRRGHRARDIVPVVRDADRKNMLQLSAEIADLAARARAGTLEPADTQGGCLVDLCALRHGRRGIGHLTPPVNAPEPAILGVSPPQREPCWTRAPAWSCTGCGCRSP